MLFSYVNFSGGKVRLVKDLYSKYSTYSIVSTETVDL